jgi:hypothetical protein
VAQDLRLQKEDVDVGKVKGPVEDMVPTSSTTAAIKNRTLIPTTMMVTVTCSMLVVEVDVFAWTM